MLIFWLGSRLCASSSCSSLLLETRLVGWMVCRLRLFLFQFHFVYDMFWLYLIYGIALYTKLVPWRLRGVTKMSVPQTARQSVLEQSCSICSTATIHCLWGGKNKLHEPRTCERLNEWIGREYKSIDPLTHEAEVGVAVEFNWRWQMFNIQAQLRLFQKEEEEANRGKRGGSGDK